MKNYVINTLGFKNCARIIFSESTDLIHNVQKSIGIEKEAEQAFIELMSTMCLLAGQLSDEQRISVKLTGGTDKCMIARAEGNGQVCGLADQGFSRHTALPKEEKGVFGSQGWMTVQRDSGMFDNYTGVTELRYESVPKNIEHYYRQSEQVDTLIRLFTAWNKEKRVIAARGLMIQLLPGGSPDLTGEFANILNDKREAFANPDVAIGFDTLQNVLQIDLKYMSHKAVNYHCGCVEEQYYGLIFSLSPDEIDEIISRNQTLEAQCSMCGKKYVFDAADVARLLGFPEPK